MCDKATSTYLAGDRDPPGNDCIIYYLQFEFFARKGLTGAAGNVEKMLKPLKMRTFQAGSPDDLRRALAKVLEEGRPSVARELARLANPRNLRDNNNLPGFSWAQSGKDSVQLC